MVWRPASAQLNKEKYMDITSKLIDKAFAGSETDKEAFLSELPEDASPVDVEEKLFLYLCKRVTPKVLGSVVRLLRQQGQPSLVQETHCEIA